jgi:transposase
VGDQGSLADALDAPTNGAVQRFFTRWYAWAVRSRLEPGKQAAAALKRHLDGVVRFANHPITNGENCRFPTSVGYASAAALLVVKIDIG